MKVRFLSKHMRTWKSMIYFHYYSLRTVNIIALRSHFSLHNDILMNMDSQLVTLLVLLDLSAAFDTVNHVVLSNCLSTSFGVSGSALHWFASNLSNRSQRVSFDQKLSEDFQLDCGVPQGSCLGPLLFMICVS